MMRWKKSIRTSQNHRNQIEDPRVVIRKGRNDEMTESAHLSAEPALGAAAGDQADTW